MFPRITVALAAAALLAGTATQAQGPNQAQMDQQRAFQAASTAAMARYTEGLQQNNRAILQESVTMWTDQVAPLVPRNRNPAMWASTKINLGLALWALGSLTEGPQGLELLASAVRAQEAALEVLTRQSAPPVWGMTQNNLGIALQSLGNRTEGPAGLALLARAATAYDAALTVFTRTAPPQAWAGSWAGTQSNLGSVLTNQGVLTEGEEGRRLLARAIAAHEAALEVLAPDNAPADWARTQHNLGTTLAILGERTSGAEGLALLTRAVQTLEATTAASPREAGPLLWAGANKDLGIALQALGTRSEGPDRQRRLQQAAAAYAEALTVFTADTRPGDRAVISGKLAAVQALLATPE